MADLARIAAIVEPEVNALGFALVRVKLFAHSEAGGEEPTLQIMAEDPATGQLVLDQCAAISHRVSDRIDALEEQGTVLIEMAYRLEVSSPGIDRPLTRAQDYARWIGHEARVELTTPIAGNRTSLHGVLAGLEDDVVRFDDRKSGRIDFALAAVRSARLVLTDALIAATRPLDAAGADEQDVDDEEDATAGDADDAVGHLAEQED